MKNKRKYKLVAMSLALMLTLTPLQAFAKSTQNTDIAIAAGQDIASVIELILDEYVGSDITADDLYNSALEAIFENLDEYSEYYTEKDYSKFRDSLTNTFLGIGISYEINEAGKPEVVKVLKGSPAEAAGLLSGDILTKVNEKNVDGLSLTEISLLIANDEKTAKIDLNRHGESKSFTITKTSLDLETVFVEKIEDVSKTAAKNDKLRYVYIDNIGDKTDKELKSAIEAMKKEGVTDIILDMRMNPGGFVFSAVEIGNMIVPKGPLFFRVDKKGNRAVVNSKLEKSPFENMVVLVDENTASAAEILAAALQDSKAATIIGKTTYGKGVMQQIFDLSDHNGFKLTIQEVLRRNGQKLNKVGVTPDIIVDYPSYIQDMFTLNASGQAPEIKQVKEILKYLGYKVGEMDSNYDSITKASIIKFCEKYELEKTDDLNENTLIKLNYALREQFLSNDTVLNKALEVLKNK